jgi:hypothetical protein
MELHLFHQGQQAGPFNLDNLADMYRCGSIGPDAMVWHEGAPDWIPITAFLAQHAPAAVTQPSASHRAAGVPLRTAATETPSESAVFLRAGMAGMAVAVLGGLGWAALQAFGTPMLQLPYAIGVSLTFLACFAVDKTSGGSSGALYLLLNLACVFVLWSVGIFGPLMFGGDALIGIYTIAGFVLSLIIAWWKSSN